MYSSRGSGSNKSYGQHPYNAQAEGDIDGYRAQSSATTHYGGQYGSMYDSTALSGISQGTAMSAKLAGSSSLEGRSGYAAISNSPKFSTNDLVSSSSLGYGHKGDIMYYSEKVPEHPSIERRQYAERLSTYVGRELQNETSGRYTDSYGFSRQHQPEFYDRINQTSVLRQEQLLKAQSLQSASLEGGSRQSELLAARRAAAHLSTHDLLYYGGRMEVDPRNPPMLSASVYGGQHALSVLGAAPRRNVDDILYAQSSANPGYGVNLPPGRNYGSVKALRETSLDRDYPGTVLSHASHSAIDERKDEKTSYLREHELREEERRQKRLRERDREREKEREREREREKRHEREHILEQREKETEREREVMQLLVSRRKKTQARASRDRRGSSLAKEGNSARKDSPRLEVLHRRHSPVREKRREYICKVVSTSLVEKERDYMSLDRRYPRLFVSPDCSKVVVNWPQGNIKLSLNTPVSFEHEFVEHEFPDVSKESSTKFQAEESAKAQRGSILWNAKIILMSGLSKNALEDLSLEKTSNERISHICNILRFAVLKKDHSFLAIGGPWGSTDGGDPTIDDSSLIQAALRYAKDKSQLNLTNCRHWNRFLEIHYDRVGEDGLFSHKEVTVLFVPDLSECLPALDAWREQWVAHKKAIVKRETQLSLRREKHREKEALKDAGSDSLKDGRRAEKFENKKELATPEHVVDGNKKENADVKGIATGKKSIEEGNDTQKKDQVETVGSQAAVSSGPRKKIVRKVRKVKVGDKKAGADSNSSTQMETTKTDAGNNVKSDNGGHQVSVSNSQDQSKSMAPQVNTEGTEMGSLAEKTTSTLNSGSTAVKKKNVRKVIRKVTRRVPKKTVAGGKANNDGVIEAKTQGDKDEKVAQVGNEATNMDMQKGYAGCEPSGVDNSENEDNKDSQRENEKSVTGIKVQAEATETQPNAKDNCYNNREKTKDGEKPKDEKEKRAKDGKDESRSKSNKEEKDEKKIEEPPQHPGFILRTKSCLDSKLRSMSLSLDSLLGYTDKDIEESTFEVSLFAESLYEMLQYQMGSRILIFLQKLRERFVDKRNRRKRQRDEAHEKEENHKSPKKRSKTDELAFKMDFTNSEAPSPTQPGDDQTKDRDNTPGKQENEAKLEDANQENESNAEDDYEEEEDPEQDPEEYEMEDADMSEEINDVNTAVNAETKKLAAEVKDEANQPGDKKSNTKATDTSLKPNADRSVKEEATIEKGGKESPAKKAPVDKELLQAFHFFDRNRVGYIRVEHMRLIIHNLGKFLSYRDVKELAQSALLETNTAIRDDRINYRKLVRMTHL